MAICEESLLAAVKSSQVPLPPAFNASPVKPWSEPEEHSEVASAVEAIDHESTANLELNKLAHASGIQLQESETYRTQEPETKPPEAVAEPQLPVPESEPQTAAVTLGSQELAKAFQILNSVETFGIQEVRSTQAKSTAAGQPDCPERVGVARGDDHERVLHALGLRVQVDLEVGLLAFASSRLISLLLSPGSPASGRTAGSPSPGCPSRGP